MTGQQLRNSILQEAIQGRLVPNVLEPGEKTGAELLQQILKERQDQENKEKGRKAKKLILSTIEEEPWGLPEEWCWCKLKDIIDFSSSGTTKNGAIAHDSWILDLEDIEKETGRLICKKRFGNVKSKSDKRAFKTGNVLYSKLRPYLNKCIIADEDGYCTTEILAFDFGPIYNRYAQSFLMSPYFVDRVNQGAAGVKMPRVNNAEANETCFPIPPLSIQHRIVAKIEELLPLVEEYDKAAGELETLNRILPDKLRKSVLQEAIHGNLVSNDIPEGEATGAELLQQILKERQDRENKEKGKKAKKLTLSTIEEEPWELPEGWCWCNLGDIVLNRDSERVPLSVEVRSRQINKQYDYYGPGGAFDKVEGYLFNKRLLLIGEDGANLLTRSKPNAFFAYGKYWVNNHVHVLDSLIPDTIILDYIALRVNGMSLADYVTGTAQPKMNQEKMNSIPIPLPPLSIQHRIVEKIEEVFSAINTL